jgi:hypothetical protein
LALAACTDGAYNPGIMYQAQSPDCDRWIDGSDFELPKEIRVFASAPKSGADGKLELGLAYFVPLGVETTFTKQVFQLTLPRGRVVSEGTVTSVDRKLKNSLENPQPLASLPNTLVGEVGGEDTMYRLNVVFNPPLPERFDFTPPDMLVGGKPFPVRTYTYRFFKDRARVGLCS